MAAGRTAPNMTAEGSGGNGTRAVPAKSDEARKPATPAKPTAADREAFSIAEAAAIWGIGRTTLYRAMADGQLRTLKIGARRLVRRDDLAAFMQAHATPAARAQ